MLRTLRARHAVGARIFVTLLQKPGDAQLRFHSRYRANNPYMREVMASFAAHAGPDDILVVKQHPLDYGIEGSAPLFRSLVADLGLQDRAYYSRKLTIESLLDIAAGLTTVNSTGGLSAINRLLPTIALGDAIYDVPGITFQDGLDRFWAGCRPPREDLVQAFVNYLASETQINGGFYSHEALTLLIGNLTAMMTNGVVAPHKTMALRRAEAPADRTSVPTVGVPAPQAI
jgi:capsular polysaccharide export protein